MNALVVLLNDDVESVFILDNVQVESLPDIIKFVKSKINDTDITRNLRFQIMDVDPASFISGTSYQNKVNTLMNFCSPWEDIAKAIVSRFV